MPDTIKRIEQDEELTALMRRWEELEEWRCHGPFVRIYSEREHGMHCVDEYGDDANRGAWDRQKIVMAVRAACEEKGWVLVISDHPENDQSPRRNTRALVERYTGGEDSRGIPARESWGGASKCRAVAVLEAYVAMLRSVEGGSDE